eukprot:scaffold6802_cov17-Tisochrysis_lutea.AAC.1
MRGAGAPAVAAGLDGGHGSAGGAVGLGDGAGPCSKLRSVHVKASGTHAWRPGWEGVYALPAAAAVVVAAAVVAVAAALVAAVAVAAAPVASVAAAAAVAAAARPPSQKNYSLLFARQWIPSG